MFDTSVAKQVRHCCSCMQNPLLQEVGPALYVLEQPRQGVCPWSSHPWPGLLADGSSVLIYVFIYLTLLLVCQGRVRERCLGREESAGTTCFPLFLPSACEDVLAFRACPSCSVRIQGATSGEAAGKSWNAVLQLGAPQHCLLHVHRPALPVHPSCCPVPSEQLCHPWRALGVVTLQALVDLLGSSVLPPSAAPWQGEGCVQLLPLRNIQPKTALAVLVMSPEKVCGLRLCSAVFPPHVAGLRGRQCFCTGRFSDTRCLSDTRHLLLSVLPCPPSLGQSRAVLPLPLLQGVRHNCGTLQQFRVVFLVLHLPANSQGSVDALLQNPSSSSNPAMAGARDQGTRAEREWQCVSLCLKYLLEVLLGLEGPLFPVGWALRKQCSLISALPPQCLQQALGTDTASPHPSSVCFDWTLG